MRADHDLPFMERACVFLGAAAIATLGAAQCPPVTPAFSWHSDADGVLFIDQTNSPFVSTQDHTWDFGDGTSGTGYLSGHVYQGADLDTVTLSFTADGCAYSISGLVAHGTAGDTCTISLAGDFSASQGNNNEVLFSHATTPGIQGFLWAFGDGSLDIFSAYPSHVYVFPGVYDVTYGVATEDTAQGTGCVAGTARRVLVDGNSSTCDTSLFANLEYFYDNGFASFQATIQLLNADLELHSVSWDYGDGSTDLAALPQMNHQYAYPGEYQVCTTIKAVHISTGDTCEARICRTLVPMLVGVAEPEKAQPRIYPVPCENELILTGPPCPSGIWTLIDMSGRHLASGRCAPSGLTSINTADLTRGTYALLSTCDGVRSVMRFVRK